MSDLKEATAERRDTIASTLFVPASNEVVKLKPPKIVECKKININSIQIDRHIHVVQLDDGGDVENILLNNFAIRSSRSTWRPKLRLHWYSRIFCGICRRRRNKYQRRRVESEVAYLDVICDRSNGRQQYTALSQSSSGGGGAEGSTSAGIPETRAGIIELEKRSRDRALSICRIYTRETSRYSLLKHLNGVGSRMDKHWFAVRDTRLKTDRLLTLAPINRNCTLNICPSTREVLNRLFLSLQHPYICPILDLDFLSYETQDYVVLVQPINQGSLKDVIYGIERNCWNEDWTLKYGSRGRGMPLQQIQRMGRQILEALMFLKTRDFPTVTHLHSGNVISQNGVARLAGLENTLLGFTSRMHPTIASRLQPSCRNPLAPESIDIICFGHMLFEMTAGYELCAFEPTTLNLADIQKYPQVIDCLVFIFDRPDGRYPKIEQLLTHDLFRNIDLRELRSASVNIFRPDTSTPISKILERIKRPRTPIKRLPEINHEDMISLRSTQSDSSDISEDENTLLQKSKELSITSV